MKGGKFAEAIGIPLWMLRNIENGRRDVDDELEAKIRAIPPHPSAARLALVPPEAGLAFVEFWNQPVEGGDGAAEVETESIVDYLAFNEKWLKGAAPSGNSVAVKAVRVRRNSMAPDMKHGDVILVDTLFKEPAVGQVYVIRRDSGLVVKELRRDGKRWMAHSRNPDDPQGPFHAKLGEEGGDVIAGKVFWRCGKV